MCADYLTQAKHSPARPRPWCTTHSSATLRPARHMQLGRRPRTMAESLGFVPADLLEEISGHLSTEADHLYIHH